MRSQHTGGGADKLPTAGAVSGVVQVAPGWLGSRYARAKRVVKLAHVADSWHGPPCLATGQNWGGKLAAAGRASARHASRTAQSAAERGILKGVGACGSLWEQKQSAHVQKQLSAANSKATDGAAKQRVIEPIQAALHGVPATPRVRTDVTSTPRTRARVSARTPPVPARAPCSCVEQRRLRRGRRLKRPVFRSSGRAKRQIRMAAPPSAAIGSHPGWGPSGRSLL